MAEEREMISVGLIGAGRIARVHAHHLRRVDGASIVAVADPAKEAAQSLAQLCGARVALCALCALRVPFVCLFRDYFLEA